MVSGLVGSSCTFDNFDITLGDITALEDSHIVQFRLQMKLMVSGCIRQVTSFVTVDETSRIDDATFSVLSDDRDTLYVTDQYQGYSSSTSNDGWYFGAASGSTLAGTA